MANSEELFVEQYTDASGNVKVFKCVKSQLQKTRGKSPASGIDYTKEMN